jgi:hypothetical protein
LKEIDVNLLCGIEPEESIEKVIGKRKDRGEGEE